MAVQPRPRCSQWSAFSTPPHAPARVAHGQALLARGTAARAEASARRLFALVRRLRSRAVLAYPYLAERAAPLRLGYRQTVTAPEAAGEDRPTRPGG